MRKLAQCPLAACGLAAFLVGLAVLGLRSAGALESTELAAYDWFLRLRHVEEPQDARLLIVSITESDIGAQGSWPLSDSLLARALETLLQHRPRAIGLDIYRDVPVPPGSEQLRTVLESASRIVVVNKYGEKGSRGIRAHPAVEGTERTGFNDILVDPGGTVRRGLLFLDDGSVTEYAFALRLALQYLQAQGVTPQPDAVNPHHLRLGRTTIPPLDPNEGAYVGADARGYQFLLDFRGAGAPFASVTLADLISGKVDPAAIQDKIVLIGVTADSVKDHFYTPHSRGLEQEQQSAGVAIHAHIVGQLLRIGLDGARPMAAMPRPLGIAWILAWGVMGAILGLRVRSPWIFSLMLSAGLAGLGLLAYVAFVHEWWMPLAPAATAWLASASIVTAYVSQVETAQRAALMRLFSSNVSREVAETIWKQRDQFLDGGRPRSQALVATALFTDLGGFTTVSEQLGPEALMDWLNEYMGAMADQVSQHGGVIRQYAGDSIVAIFGVPIARVSETEIAQDAINAVACALAMETTLRDLNRAWAAAERPTTTMRVGVFTGPAVAGTLGSAERSEYVVVGDTINTASRLESFDKSFSPPDPLVHPCRVLIGATTRAYLGDRFATQRVGGVTLKGKEQAVEMYRVLGWASATTAALPEGGPP